LANRWKLGGNLEFEDHDADVGPYRRNQAGVYLEIPKLLKGNLRLSADRIRVDREDTSEDIDLTRYGLRYFARLWYRTTLNADYVDETDTGGTIERSNTRASVRLSWAYRQLELSGEARYYTNRNGESERDRSLINLVLTRNF
jgi:hypothetical protein